MKLFLRKQLTDLSNQLFSQKNSVVKEYNIQTVDCEATNIALFLANDNKSRDYFPC